MQIGCMVMVETRFCDRQSFKGNNSKVKMQELWFLHFANQLMLIDICMNFHKDSLNGFQVIGRTRLGPDFVMDKVPREITKKV